MLLVVVFTIATRNKLSHTAEHMRKVGLFPGVHTNQDVSHTEDQACYCRDSSQLYRAVFLRAV